MIVTSISEGLLPGIRQLRQGSCHSHRHSHHGAAVVVAVVNVVVQFCSNRELPIRERMNMAQFLGIGLLHLNPKPLSPQPP